MSRRGLLRREGAAAHERLWLVRGLIAGLACAACACPPAAALASARVDDAAATRAYLRADYAYDRGVHAELGAIAAAVEARASEIGGECPSALTYAPRDAAFDELGEEAVRSVLYAAVAPVRALTLHLASTIGRLGWSDRRLTRLVRAEAAEDRASATLALPDVCADIAAWKASAYATLPPSAASFLARVQAIESRSAVGPSEESRKAATMRLLRPFERPGERRVAKRIHRLEGLIDRRLAAAWSAAHKRLVAMLGVSAL